MVDFKLRKLHRQRTRRRHDVEVLGGNELAQRLGMPIEQLIPYLTKHKWPFHLDSSKTVWMTVRKHTSIPVFERSNECSQVPGGSE